MNDASTGVQKLQSSILLPCPAVLCCSARRSLRSVDNVLTYLTDVTGTLKIGSANSVRTVGRCQFDGPSLPPWKDAGKDDGESKLSSSKIREARRRRTPIIDDCRTRWHFRLLYIPPPCEDSPPGAPH